MPIGLKKLSFVTISVLCAALLLLGTFLFFTRIHNEGLYGTWQLVSQKEGMTTVPIESYDMKYLGFVLQHGKNYVRTYLGNDATSSLFAIHPWTLKAVGAEKLLREYYYTDDPMASSSTPTNTYIATLGADTLTLTQMYYDNSTGTVRVYKRVRSAADEAAQDFSRTQVETSIACENILNGTSDQSNVSLPISCDFDIGGGAGTATLAIDDMGNLTIEKKGVTILKISNEFSSPSDSQGASITNSSGPFLSGLGPITVQDVTYDGYKDLTVLVSAGVHNFTYVYYAYDPQTGRYAPKPLLEAVNPEVDIKAQTIISNDRELGLNDVYSKDTYTFENGAYVLTREESQNYADQKNFDGNAGYIHTISTLQNGKMVQIFREFLTQQ